MEVRFVKNYMGKVSGQVADLHPPLAMHLLNEEIVERVTEQKEETITKKQSKKSKHEKNS
jgi:hypothetical protein